MGHESKSDQDKEDHAATKNPRVSVKSGGFAWSLETSWMDTGSKQAAGIVEGNPEPTLLRTRAGCHAGPFFEHPGRTSHPAASMAP